MRGSSNKGCTLKMLMVKLVLLLLRTCLVVDVMLSSEIVRREWTREVDVTDDARLEQRRHVMVDERMRNTGPMNVWDGE
jgi:hypothetical protein